MFCPVPGNPFECIVNPVVDADTKNALLVYSIAPYKLAGVMITIGATAYGILNEKVAMAHPAQGALLLFIMIFPATSLEPAAKEMVPA